jgi:hypothetical protein
MDKKLKQKYFEAIKKVIKILPLDHFKAQWSDHLNDPTDPEEIAEFVWDNSFDLKGDLLQEYHDKAREERDGMDEIDKRHKKIYDDDKICLNCFNDLNHREHTYCWRCEYDYLADVNERALEFAEQDEEYNFYALLEGEATVADLDDFLNKIQSKAKAQAEQKYLDVIKKAIKILPFNHFRADWIKHLNDPTDPDEIAEFIYVGSHHLEFDLIQEYYKIARVEKGEIDIEDTFCRNCKKDYLEELNKRALKLAFKDYEYNFYGLLKLKAPVEKLDDFLNKVQSKAQAA